MAFMENIISDEIINTDLKLQLKQRNSTQYNEAEMAATTIQRHYKGYYTRVYISKLHLAATIIQKHWRRYMARKYYNDLSIKTFVIKSIDYYNKAAIVIQRHFRGYHTRKYNIDMKKITKWIDDIQKKNDIWAEAMNDYKKNVCAKYEIIYKEQVKHMINEMVYKHHPMLRTTSKKGVFSKKQNVYDDSEFEKLIRDMYAQITKKKLKK